MTFEHLKYIEYNILMYVYNKYRSKLPSEFANKDVYRFLKGVKNRRKDRYTSGCIVVNDNQELLCIINYQGKLNLPKGKQDYSDNNNKKVTAFREVYEEAGIVLSTEEQKTCNDFIDIYSFGNYVRLFYIENFPKDRVDLTHSQPGEVQGLYWLPLQDTMSHIKQNKPQLTVLIKDVLRMSFGIWLPRWL